MTTFYPTDSVDKAKNQKYPPEKLRQYRDKSPTDTCRAIDELRLPWPYTRSIWRRNSVFRREATAAQAARGECGHVNHCALDILEDVIGWYRINRRRDERSGEIIAEERLFDGERLQKDYAQWGDDLGYTKRQMQEAVAHLHAAGLVKRTCEVIQNTFGVKVGNAVFLTIYFKSHGLGAAFCESACQRRNQSMAEASFTIAR